MPRKRAAKLKRKIQDNELKSSNDKQVCSLKDQSDDKFDLEKSLQIQGQEYDSDYNENSQQILNNQKLMRFFESQNEQNEVLMKLSIATDNFDLTYTKIKEKQLLEEPPLRFLKKQEIQYLIRFCRQKFKREGKKDISLDQQQDQNNIVSRKRRSSSGVDSDFEEPIQQKRQYKEHSKELKENGQSIVKSLLNIFDNLNHYQQNKIQDALHTVLTNDNEIHLKILKNQISLNIKDACSFYEAHQMKELLKLLSKLSPLACIYLNIEISLYNNQLTEESGTLAQILLPSLNLQYDYNFFKGKHNFTLNRFLHSLLKHIKDSNLEVQKGFMLFVLYMDAKQVQDILFNERNKISLQKALQHLGFSSKASLSFVKFPKSLLWNLVIEYLKGKEESVILENLQILSKLKVINDPGNFLKKINNVFAQRRMLVDILITKDKIDMTIDNLVNVLENVVLLQTSAIIKCLQQESKQWLKLSQQSLNQEQVIEDSISKEQVQEILNTFNEINQEPKTMEDFEKLSFQLSQDNHLYRHNLYQYTIASIIAQCKEQFIIAIIPTGQGKTWIQGLLSKYFCQNKNKVTLIEPNERLQTQTAEKIAGIDYAITIANPQWFYEYNPKDSIIIIDEYDEFINSSPFTAVNNQLTGLWNLKDRKVIAFSATSSTSLEKFVNNVISTPRILRFPSQYEIINGISHLQLGHIQNAPNKDDLMSLFRNDLLKYYDSKPIIIILDSNQIQQVISCLKEENFRYLIGDNDQNVQEIRQWEYGIIVLQSGDARGLDVRFAKNAIVLITAEVTNELQYQQYIGRSSRSMGTCEGVLYIQSIETPSQIMNKLKKQNFTKYQELEYVIKLFMKKAQMLRLQKLVRNQTQWNNFRQFEQSKTIYW